MKVLLLSRFGTLGASSRLRTYQYIPYLNEQGVQVTVAHLLDNNYLQALYLQKRPKIADILAAYVRRGIQLLRSRDYDLIWIQNELFPWLPAWAEGLLATSKVPYVVDYDDAVFHRYDQHRRQLVQTLLGHKIDRVMRYASLVIVGNDYLLERARQVGARSVELLPTVIDLERYPIPPAAKSPDGRDFRIGWVGLPFGLQYLRSVQPALARVCAGGQARLVIVTAKSAVPPELSAEVREWAEDTEVDDIRTFDVGIMPLVDNAWERGKCGYKLIQYMACGKPVIASPVGVNRQIVEDGVNGFLASSQEEWVRALNILRTDVDLRKRMGQAGRAKVERQYCTQVTAPRLLSLLQWASGAKSSQAVPEDAANIC